MSEHGPIYLYHLARTSECDQHVIDGGGTHLLNPFVGITRELRGLMNYITCVYHSAVIYHHFLTCIIGRVLAHPAVQQQKPLIQGHPGLCEKLFSLALLVVLPSTHSHHLHHLSSQSIATPEHKQHVGNQHNSFPCSQEMKSVGQKITGPNSHNEAIAVKSNCIYRQRRIATVDIALLVPDSNGSCVDRWLELRSCIFGYRSLNFFSAT